MKSQIVSNLERITWDEAKTLFPGLCQVNVHAGLTPNEVWTKCDIVYGLDEDGTLLMAVDNRWVWYWDSVEQDWYYGLYKNDPHARSWKSCVNVDTLL